MIMETLKLTESERRFLQDVRLAIFANPFSDERAKVDSRITGSLIPVESSKHVQNLIRIFEERLNNIFRGGRRTLEKLRGEDRELVQNGFLFLIFHKYCNEFDEHIREQIVHGDASCRVDFADRVLEEMIAHGMSTKEANRFFALFFQMRRAFYFINRIIGKSPCMKALRENLWNNIFTTDIGLYEQHLWNRMEDFSTMLLGATGTGKGLSAAAIGRSGFIPFDNRRKCFKESFTRAFISINLSQYPDQLLESELFGHKKGSFTGAIESHDGIFALCSPCGGIFLDEIGEVTIPVQIKLLHVLQEREFSPVGSHAKKRFSGRVIAATNQSVDELREKGKFRDDFYYRLCSDIIYVPTLFQRIQEDPEELDDLLALTLKRIIGKSSPELVISTAKTLKEQIPMDYPWPGNVRELEQCVRRILVKKHYEGDKTISTIPDADLLDSALCREKLTAQQIMGRYCAALYAQHGTYEAVARITQLDRRTVKKYVDSR